MVQRRGLDTRGERGSDGGAKARQRHAARFVMSAPPVVARTMDASMAILRPFSSARDCSFTAAGQFSLISLVSCLMLQGGKDSGEGRRVSRVVWVGGLRLSVNCDLTRARA